MPEISFKTVNCRVICVHFCFVLVTIMRFYREHTVVLVVGVGVGVFISLVHIGLLAIHSILNSSCSVPLGPGQLSR